MSLEQRQRSRLALTLSAFFALLVLPIGAIVWQAFDQLEFEAFYEHRNQAEILTARIDTRLSEAVGRAEARGFADFSFLNVTEPGNANILQRSPLAAFPVSDALPGVLGYFQVDADGEFSTPLLPSGEASALGIPDTEYTERRQLATQLRGILAENRLVQRVAPASRLNLDDTVEEAEQRLLLEKNEAEDFAEELAAAPATAPAETVGTESRAFSSREAGNTQQAFDDLIPSRQRSDDRDGTADEPAAAPANTVLRERLNVDEELEAKSDALKQSLENTAPSQDRVRRLEQTQLPAPTLSAGAPSSADLDANTGRILTFESEIDPYYFRRLDSGHFVLFRRVWRESQRYVQGLLLDQDLFLQTAMLDEYSSATLAGMSDMIVGYQGEPLRTIAGGDDRSYPAAAGGLDGTHLYSRPLSAPFDSIEVLFTINRLPLGPGAGVLAWTTAAFGLILVLGFLLLYRLGLSQLRVARQQQDFVSAVSHELKTPLTSIRMYGEMLREGWVEEAKRKQYYAYIHDEAERLSKLISNVLRLAKISHSEPQLELGQLPVRDALSEIEQKIANQVERAGFELRTSDGGIGDSSLRIDIDALTQIVINLVDNALKFSKDTSSKRIDLGFARASADQAVLTVRDYGPGIPKDQLKKIFMLFYRGESELTRETIGTGIGLAIVRELTVAMNGTVDVVNKDPGAEFRIGLPIVD